MFTAETTKPFSDIRFRGENSERTNVFTVAGSIALNNLSIGAHDGAWQREDGSISQNGTRSQLDIMEELKQDDVV